MSNQYQASAGPSSGRPRNQQQDGTSQAQAPRGRRPIQYRGLFQRDLPNMMYGFGDSRNPDQRSIELMERLTITFLVDLCHRCRPAPYAHPSSSRNNPYLTRSRVKIDDLRFALRKDDKKLARLEELVYLEGVISGAKKILSNDVVDDVARQVEAEERLRANERGETAAIEEEEDEEGAQAMTTAATVAGAAEGGGGGGGGGRGSSSGRGRGRGGGAAGDGERGGGAAGRKRKRGAASGA